MPHDGTTYGAGGNALTPLDREVADRQRRHAAGRYVAGWQDGYDAALEYLTAELPELDEPYDDDEQTIVSAAREHRDAVVAGLRAVLLDT